MKYLITQLTEEDWMAAKENRCPFCRARGRLNKNCGSYDCPLCLAGWRRGIEWDGIEKDVFFVTTPGRIPSPIEEIAAFCDEVT